MRTFDIFEVGEAEPCMEVSLTIGSTKDPCSIAEQVAGPGDYYSVETTQGVDMTAAPVVS